MLGHKLHDIHIYVPHWDTSRKGRICVAVSHFIIFTLLQTLTIGRVTFQVMNLCPFLSPFWDILGHNVKHQEEMNTIFVILKTFATSKPIDVFFFMEDLLTTYGVKERVSWLLSLWWRTSQLLFYWIELQRLGRYKGTILWSE